MTDMLGSKEKASFLPPLFDRLDPEAPTLLTAEQVKESIRHEISLMLNTRAVPLERPMNTEGGSDLEDAPLYVMPNTFGVMDLSSWGGEDSSNWPALARYLERCIASFDPRLKNPKVTIREFNTSKQEISLTLSGTAVFGEHTEHLTFPLAMSMDKRE